MEKTVVSEINAYMRNSGISIIIKENEISANKVFFAVDSLPSGIVGITGGVNYAYVQSCLTQTVVNKPGTVKRIRT